MQKAMQLRLFKIAKDNSQPPSPMAPSLRMPHNNPIALSRPRGSLARPRQTTSPRAPAAVSRGLDPRWMAFAPSQDTQVLKYALGTLDFRKQRTRKRTSTGEYVWSDEADLVFALALIAWTSNRSNRIGTRRAVFLQQFLTRYGFTKSRKQIASRLQVLKGEWGCSSYLDLLKDPDDSEISRRRRGSSMSSLPEEQSPASHMPAPVARTPPALSCAPLFRDFEDNCPPRTARPEFAEESMSFGIVPLCLPMDFGSQSHGPFEHAFAHPFDQRPQEMTSFPTIKPQIGMAGYQPQSHTPDNPIHGSLFPTMPHFLTPDLAINTDCLSSSKDLFFDNNFVSPSSSTNGLLLLDTSPGAYFAETYPFSY